jgi:uncharacterized protein (DUF924 family)
MTIQPDIIISFWYSKRISPFWFRSTEGVDQEIRDKFYDLWLQAEASKLDDWLSSAEGCLALVIVLDQFPLNMFRNQARSFATEAQAISVCKHAILHGYDHQIDKSKLSFLYIPLMHSENSDDQNMSVALYQQAGLDANVRFAQHHRDIIKRFGRFPHRNAVLGRESTQQEIEYLSSDSSFKG